MHRRTPWLTPNVKRFRVDARRLERWLVKTAVNLVTANAAKPLRIGTYEGDDLVPPALVDICFGRRKFQGFAGMYIAGSPNRHLDLIDQLKFTPVIEAMKESLVGISFFMAFQQSRGLMRNAHPLQWQGFPACRRIGCTTYCIAPFGRSHGGRASTPCAKSCSIGEMVLHGRTQAGPDLKSPRPSRVWLPAPQLNSPTSATGSVTVAPIATTRHTARSGRPTVSGWENFR